MPEVEESDLLLQEVYADDPWRMLVCCILLNQTGRKQVDTVRDRLFERWPTARVMAYAYMPELTELLRPLGLQNRRANTLRNMSAAWVVYERLPLYGMPPPVEVIETLPGCGDYALDSYRIFVLKDASEFRSGDKEIAAWFQRRAEAARSSESEGSEGGQTQIPPLRGGI